MNPPPKRQGTTCSPQFDEDEATIGRVNVFGDGAAEVIPETEINFHKDATQMHDCDMKHEIDVLLIVSICTVSLIEI